MATVRHDAHHHERSSSDQQADGGRATPTQRTQHIVRLDFVEGWAEAVSPPRAAGDSQRPPQRTLRGEKNPQTGRAETAAAATWRALFAAGPGGAVGATGPDVAAGGGAPGVAAAAGARARVDGGDSTAVRARGAELAGAAEEAGESGPPGCCARLCCCLFALATWECCCDPAAAGRPPAGNGGATEGAPGGAEGGGSAAAETAGSRGSFGGRALRR